MASLSRKEGAGGRPGAAQAPCGRTGAVVHSDQLCPCLDGQALGCTHHGITPEGKVSVAQSCPTLCDPMDCSPPSSSVHGILQARVLEWVAIPFSLPDPGIEPTSLPGLHLLRWQAGSLALVPPGKPPLTSVITPNNPLLLSSHLQTCKVDAQETV